MASYRCYFFGEVKSPFGVPCSFKAAENLEAETDEDARRLAEAMYRERGNQLHGFEVWRAARLIYRHAMQLGDDRRWR